MTVPTSVCPPTWLSRAAPLIASPSSAREVRADDRAVGAGVDEEAERALAIDEGGDGHAAVASRARATGRPRSRGRRRSAARDGSGIVGDGTACCARASVAPSAVDKASRRKSSLIGRAWWACAFSIAGLMAIVAHRRISLSRDARRRICSFSPVRRSGKCAARLNRYPPRCVSLEQHHAGDGERQRNVHVQEQPHARRRFHPESE